MTYTIIGLIALLGIIFLLKSKSTNNSNIKNINAQELEKLLFDNQVKLIDVRSSREVLTGVIGSPIHFELGPSLPKKLDSLDPSFSYVVYCRSGRRSALACQMMHKKGFNKVANLEGGIIAWAENHPITTFNSSK